MKRYYRNEEDNSIFDRETGKTIYPLREEYWHKNYILIKDYKEELIIDRDDIEEKR